MGKAEMAKGKNKQTVKKSKRVEKHAFLKKEWYRLLSPPAIEGCHSVGWVPGNKTIGEKMAKDNVLGRICEISYGDLTGNNDRAHQKVKMQVEEVEGSNLFTSFHGIDSTKETVCKVLKKKVSTIEIWCDVKTMDDFILRVFVTVITSRNYGQKNKNAYAKSSQIRVMRKKVNASLIKKAASMSHSGFAKIILNSTLAQSLTGIAKGLLPINTLIVRKVKVLKKSKIDIKSLAKESKAARVQAENTKKAVKPVEKKADDAAEEMTEEKTEETPAAQE